MSSNPFGQPPVFDPFRTGTPPAPLPPTGTGGAEPWPTPAPAEPERPARLVGRIPQGRVFGVAGGGLQNASWAANAEVAKVGQGGEIRTAGILDPLAAPEGGPTVLHDVLVPTTKYTMNVDHVVISANNVWLIDTKVWKPGFLWTLFGVTRRGWKKFPPADKRGMSMARDMIRGYLDNTIGPGACVIETPTLVVWPSSERPRMNTLLLKVPGADVMTPGKFERTLERRFRRRGDHSANPAVVAALLPFLATPPKGGF